MYIRQPVTLALPTMSRDIRLYDVFLPGMLPSTCAALWPCNFRAILVKLIDCFHLSSVEVSPLVVEPMKDKGYVDVLTAQWGLFSETLWSCWRLDWWRKMRRNIAIPCRRMLLRCPLGMGFWKYASLFIPYYHIYYNIASTMLIRYHWRRWIVRKASFGSSCGIKLFPFVAVFLWLSTQFLLPQSPNLKAHQSVCIEWFRKFGLWGDDWLFWYWYRQVCFRW